MNRFREYMMCFALGALIYGIIEVTARGYTHWTMALTGGAVMALFYLINRSREINLFVRCLLGTVVITSLEFGVGMVVNVALGWGVWDYSDKLFNVWGQICPLFSVAWFFLSIPAFMLCDFVEKKLNTERKVNLR